MVSKNLERMILAGSLTLAVGASGAVLGNHIMNTHAETTKAVTDESENHYQEQRYGSTIEYGGQKYSMLSKYVATNHEAVGWEMRGLIGTKSSEVAIFTDQLQPGQYFYTGATPNHTILTDDEWAKAIGQQSSYGDLSVRIGTRYLNDKDGNGKDLKTGTLKYIAPEFLNGLKVDSAMAEAGQSDKKDAVTAQSDDSKLKSSGYKQGDKDKTTADSSQIEKLMSLVKSQAIQGLKTSTSTAGNVYDPGKNTDSGEQKLDYSKIESIGVNEGPNGFYTYDAKARQLKFVIYNLEKVKTDGELTKSVIKSLGSTEKVEAAKPSDVAKAAEEAGAPSSVVSSIDGADKIAVTKDNELLALKFTNLYMHEIRVMVPVAVESGNVVPNQFDYAGASWDGASLGKIGSFEVSNKPKIVVPGTSGQQKPTDPDKPYKNVLAEHNITLQNGYNWYGKATDDTINADDQNDAKSAEASFAVGSPLNFSKTGIYKVKAKANFAPGVYIVRATDKKDIKASADGTVLKNGALLSVTEGSQLNILDGSGNFQLVDATSVLSKTASAQAIAKVTDGKHSKVIEQSEVKGKDATLDALMASVTSLDSEFSWVVSQPIPKDYQNASGLDVKLVDDLAQDKLEKVEIVDTKNPSKVLKKIDAKDYEVSDKNVLTYLLKDYESKEYGNTASFKITVKGSTNTAHKDTATIQLFKDGKSLSENPVPTNTVKIITAQPKDILPTNPVTPDEKQNPKTPGTPEKQEPKYTPANEDGYSRVNTPVSEALGDIANDSSTPAPVQNMAATGAYLASSTWFLVLFPLAVLGTVAEGIYKKKTGNWFTIAEWKRLRAAKLSK